jgi:hypothetical protein
LDYDAAENSFGICLKRAIGVQRNVALASQCYQRSGNHGHFNGANNFGFCFQHGHGVPQNVAITAAASGFLVDGKLPIGRPKSPAALCSAVIWHLMAARKDPAQFNDDSTELIVSIEQLKQSRQARLSPPAEPENASLNLT